MGSLEAFVHHENLILFKRQLADPRTPDGQRQMLLRLLAEEEAKQFPDQNRSDKLLALQEKAMIRLELLRDRGILILSPEGALGKADFEQLAQEIDPFIAANGKLAGLMIFAKTFPGWDSFGALVSHLRFVKDHHRRVKRVAIVTDSEFLKTMPQIAKHFVAAQVRQFPSDQRTEALAWLEAQ
jgi:hypothetical protein